MKIPKNEISVSNLFFIEVFEYSKTSISYYFSSFRYVFKIT
jgi:hypothetical protein